MSKAFNDKIDLEDDIPRHQKKASKKKPFGIQYLSGYCRWYETRKARDQALHNLQTKPGQPSLILFADARKIDR